MFPDVESINIGPAKNLEGIFNNTGVWLALDHVFRHPEGIVDKNSHAYKQIVRAYWALPDYSK